MTDRDRPEAHWVGVRLEAVHHLGSCHMSVTKLEEGFFSELVEVIVMVENWIFKHHVLSTSIFYRRVVCRQWILLIWVHII